MDENTGGQEKAGKELDAFLQRLSYEEAREAGYLGEWLELQQKLAEELGNADSDPGAARGGRC